jgi:hypothetical protein
LGLNNATIEFTLSATEPTDVIYLTENDATRLGLAVAIVPGCNRIIALEGRIGLRRQPLFLKKSPTERCEMLSARPRHTLRGNLPAG